MLNASQTGPRSHQYDEEGLILAGGLYSNNMSIQDHRQRKPRINSGGQFFLSMEER
jgi:hypothetical protein